MEDGALGPASRTSAEWEATFCTDTQRPLRRHAVQARVKILRQAISHYGDKMGEGGGGGGVAEIEHGPLKFARRPIGN